MAEPTQTYGNHAKIIPLYHYVAFPILTANFLWSAWALLQAPGTGTVIAALTAFAIIVMYFYARVFALRVQDRVIRLEMRMRLKELLPAALHSRIGEFTPGQLVALRFAGDAELPELAQTVLRDGITDKKAIKLLIRTWNPDHLRA